MSNKTNEESNSQAVPFFARFLETQQSEQSMTPYPETKKYPSDEDE